MAGSGAYLPPVVAELTADNGDFIRKIAEMKAMLAALAQQVTAMKVVADTGPFAGKIAALRAMTNAMEMSIKVDADTLGAWASIGALKAASLATAVSRDASLLSLLWGGGAQGIGMAGIGGIGGFNLGKGLAGIGSAGALAGFGMEHLLMTIIGIIGSGIGGAIGGGLLGMGALGTMGVGMGSDLVVAKSTMGDASTLAKLYENIAKAQAVYGVNSRQAEIAQNRLNFAIKEMGGASAIGVAAEIRLGQAVAGLNEHFDQLTQRARASFVNNIALPLVQIADGYIPLVAAAAERNFGIIGQYIKPLFTWLGTEGHNIFQDLENVFARDLPIGVQIFVQALELLFSVMDRIATSNNFGGVLQRILAYVSNLNGLGFDHLMQNVNKAIALFHLWTGFVGALGRVIFDVFSRTLGVGSSVIALLTNMLNQLDRYINSAKGNAALRNLFEVHKQQVLELLKLIPLLISAVGPVYIQLATTFTSLTLPIIAFVLHIVDFLTHLGGGVGQIISFALGLLLIETRLKAISIAIGLVQGAIGIFKTIQVVVLALSSGMLAQEFAANAAAAGIERAGLATGILTAKQIILTAWTWLATAATTAWDAALALNPIGIVVLAVAALVVGLILLVTHFQQVHDWLTNVYNRFGLLISIVSIFLGPVGMLINLVALLITHWHDIATRLQEAHQWLVNVYNRFGLLITIISLLLGPVGMLLNLIGLLITHFQDLAKWASTLPIVGGFFKNMAGTIDQSTKASSSSVKAMKNSTTTDMAQMSASGIGSMHALAMDTQTYADQMNIRTKTDVNSMKGQLIDSFNQMFGQGSAATKRLSDMVTNYIYGMKNKGVSDTTVMKQQMIDQMTQLFGKGSFEAQMLTQQINNYFQQLPADGSAAGAGLVNGLISGMLAKKQAALDTALSLGEAVGASVRRGTQSESPSRLTIQVGRWLVEGLIMGIRGRLAAAVETGALLGRSVGSAILPRPNLGAFGAIGGGGGGGNVTIHSNPTIQINGVSSGGNPILLARQLQKALDDHTASLSKSLMGGAYLPGQGIT